MALSCQRGQEGDVRQRSPLSALTLQDQEGRDRLGEIGLLYDSLMAQNPLCHPNQEIKVNQKKIKIRATKSWLTTTSSSGTVPQKCCYFVLVGGLACLAGPRGYASWSFDSWLVQPCWTGSGLEARLNATHRWCWQHQCMVYGDDLVMWWLSQSPGWTSHGPMTRNAWVMSGTISHAGTHYSLM